MAAGNDVVAEKKKSVSIQPGAVIRCTTTLGEKFEGEVMGYDEESKAVVIKTLPSIKGQLKSVYDVVVVNLTLVDQCNFELVTLPKGEPPPLPDIDKEKINRRLKSAKDRVGIGVSPQAQELFDFIRKTIQECHWTNQNITVLEEVNISPPYKSENCSGKSKTSLEYIKNIVIKFYKDKASPSSSSPVSSPPLIT